MVHLNMNRYDQTYTRRSKRNILRIIISELDSNDPLYNKLKYGKVGEQEVDSEYAWLLSYSIQTMEQEKVTICEDQNEYDNKYEYEYENDSEDEDDVDGNNKDPEYCMFLENLTEHGKSYKLKISQNDEEPCFVFYEEQENSDCCDDLQTIHDSGDEVTISEDMLIKQKVKRMPNEKNGEISTKKEVSSRKKINDHKSTPPPRQGFIVDPSYSVYLKSVKCEEQLLEDEKKVATSDSDSDIVILDNVQNCSEVNNKQLVLAEKEPSLREKLMHDLKRPYDEKEHEELSEYMEQEKPICRTLALRSRSISSAMGGVKKSVLDYAPERFRSMLNAAQSDPPKALNLLRMFRFWLEHVPNIGAFQPWKDKHLLKVRPSEKTHMKPRLLLEDK